MTPPPFHIRRGVRDDAAPLAAFAAKIFTETFGPDNRPQDVAAYVASAYGPSQQAGELENPTVVTLVAEAGPQVAGYAQVRRHTAPECVTGDDPVELWRFYVDRPWQGSGLAQELMAAVHRAAHELGGRTIWLGVGELNPRAIAFYAKCGFRDVGSHPFLLGEDRQMDRVMVIDVRE
jgi:ribosomal protein S18 acetylase RimI-like enzyme